MVWCGNDSVPCVSGVVCGVAWHSVVHSQKRNRFMQVVDFTGLMQIANKLYQAC